MSNELRAKFEVWWQRLLQTPGSTSYNSQMPAEGDYQGFAWLAYQAAHSSRDAEVEALRKDAERYRWLSRKHANPVEKDWYVYGATGPFLSDSIDAAMREESK